MKGKLPARYSRSSDSPSSQKRESAYDLCRPLIQQAKEQKKWLYSRHTQLWLSPEELESLQRIGHYCWGPAFWELRDPLQELSRLRVAATVAQDVVDRFEERLNNAGRSS